MRVSVQVQNLQPRLESLKPEARGQLLEGFFNFNRYPRIFDDLSAFRDVTVCSVTFNYFVKEWPTAPPPHPAFFQSLFPLLMQNLVGGQTLTLHVKSVDADCFEESATIRNRLMPFGHRYALMNEIATGFQFEKTLGNLFFEWPADSLDDKLCREWFVSPQVTMQGFVAPNWPIEALTTAYFRPDDLASMRELLRHLDFGFCLSRDFNELIVLTDKSTEETLTSRILTPTMATAIEEVVIRYEKASEPPRS